MDLSMLAPDLGKLLGLQPSTLVLLIVIANVAGRAAARSIPSDATGFWGFVRQLAAIVGAEVDNRVTTGDDGKAVTATQIAKAAFDTPPVPEKVEEQK